MRMNWGKLRNRDKIRRRGAESVTGDGNVAAEFDKALNPHKYKHKPPPFILPPIPLQPTSVKIKCPQCGHTAKFRPTHQQATNLPKLTFKCRKCGGAGRPIPKLADVYS